MSTKLLLPLLNTRVRTFGGPTWYLSESVSLETISPEDYGLILASCDDEYRPLIDYRSKCIRINGVAPNISPTDVHTECSKISFVLNYFAEADPIGISFAVQVSKKRKARIDRIVELSTMAGARFHRRGPYRLRRKATRETVSQFYRVVAIVYSKHPCIQLTFDRFSSALERPQLNDKIIDITIAMESLIDGTNELRNRFSMYNAWSTENDGARRENSFLLLRSLYDARSAIVHGVTMSAKEHRKRIDAVADDWAEIVRIAERAIGYHLLYVYNRGPDTWHTHQRNLTLGIEKRIV